MTSHEFERSLVYLAEQIIRTFGKDYGFEVRDIVEPTEPLIDDSKACKIVRDWYNYNGSTLPVYCEDACTLSINHGAKIEFQERVFGNLRQDYRYNITELCGGKKNE